MALEKTVVASDVPPVRQFIANNETGLLVDFFSPEAVAESISKVLQHKDNYRHIGQAARVAVVENFDFESVCYPNFLNFVNKNLKGGLQIAL